jgi:hypothetical protein
MTQAADSALAIASAELRWLNSLLASVTFQGGFLQHDPVMRRQLLCATSGRLIGDDLDQSDYPVIGGKY